VEEALDSGAAVVGVVIGAFATEVSDALNTPKVEIITNMHWEQGKGTGIATGVRHVLDKHPDIAQFILAVCDQPFISASLFRQLHQEQQESGKGIVASAYAGTLGTPVLLTRKYVGPLLHLEKDAGAKQIIQAYQDDVAAVDFPLGHIDIDTREDYEGLLG
jgi:molybdenum cofactor cytidylyltransferase